MIWDGVSAALGGRHDAARYTRVRTPSGRVPGAARLVARTRAAIGEERLTGPGRELQTVLLAHWVG